jgi:hypothetical protein
MKVFEKFGVAKAGAEDITFFEVSKHFFTVSFSMLAAWICLFFHIIGK